MICSYPKSLNLFRTFENGLNSDYFAKIAKKIGKFLIKSILTKISGIVFASLKLPEQSWYFK